MLIKMKESKGFTLVELMIVVAIIGILAAVAVPFYQRYIQKSRLTSLVFPGMHAIETNLGSYYSFQQSFPADLVNMADDADTRCFTPSIAGNNLTITIDGDTGCEPLTALNGMVLTAEPIFAGNKIRSWALSGDLAERLGLSGEGNIQ